VARFSDEEVRRYARQIVLPEVGGVGQERLRAASAACESELEALYLAAAGVGRLTVPSSEIAFAVKELNPLVEVQVGGAPPSPAGDTEVDAAALRAVEKLKEILAL
jgi:molybdopterin/thiamine biosynthesis adenylyltransferase